MKGLTPARRGFLEQLIREGGSGAGADYYPPIKWLHENGLLEKREGRYSNYWHVTDAGRAAVSPQERCEPTSTIPHVRQGNPQ